MKNLSRLNSVSCFRFCTIPDKIFRKSNFGLKIDPFTIAVWTFIIQTAIRMTKIEVPSY